MSFPKSQGKENKLNIAKVFDTAAKDYDTTRRKYIACFDDFYGVAMEQIPFPKDTQFTVLDLGAGTGLFSGLVRESFPHCEITLTDISDEMLEKAKERFSGQEKINFITHDYVNDSILGNYDVVISGVSLHHSTKDELKIVFGKLFACLKSGGIFINADQVLGETPEIEKQYEKAWLQQAKEKQCTEEEIAVALKRMEADKTLPLSAQLSLLSGAGFEMVNCWYQYYRYVVYSGCKPRG